MPATEADADRLAYGYFVHGCRNGRVLANISPCYTSTQRPGKLAVVSSSSPSPLLFNHVECAGIKMNLRLLGSDICRLPRQTLTGLPRGILYTAAGMGGYLLIYPPVTPQHGGLEIWRWSHRVARLLHFPTM